MIIPLDELISYSGNRYELTCAAIKRATQINLTNTEDEREKKNKKKIVSHALNEVLLNKIKYKIEED